ncbi:MAG: Rrf2 family transcriptional regulator [Brumimicrobium sp.]
MFSKACEYGIKSSIYLAQQALKTENKINVQEIATSVNSPEAFTAKVLRNLVENKILYSSKGPNGGFFVPKEKLSEIRLSEIVSAIDGDEVYTGCGLGLEACDDNRPCPLHDKFIVVREELRKTLEATTLLELANGIDSGLTFLKR